MSLSFFSSATCAWSRLKPISTSSLIKPLLESFTVIRSVCAAGTGGGGGGGPGDDFSNALGGRAGGGGAGEAAFGGYWCGTGLLVPDASMENI